MDEGQNYHQPDEHRKFNVYNFNPSSPKGCWLNLKLMHHEGLYICCKY